MPIPHRVRLGILDERAPVGSHIAYLWETPAEFEAAVRFLAVGLDEGDFCVIFGHDEANQRVIEVLGRHGYNARDLEARGRLAVVSGHANAETLLSTIGRTFQAALDRGATLLRLLGNIGWGKPGWPNEADILSFEARVTGAAKQFPSVIVCMYDVRALPGRIVLHGAFETHPLTICGNVLRQNNHWVEADEFLRRVPAEDDEPAV